MPFIQKLDPTIGLLQKTLNLRSQNQQIISSNIANADTPGYAPATMHFEDQLSSALGAGTLTSKPSHPGHIPIAGSGLSQVQAKIVREPDTTGIGDQNGVSVDQEMVKLSENQLMYETTVTILSKKLALLKYVANDGR